MCGRFVIFTVDEVLELVQAIEVGWRDNPMPDYPARPVCAVPGAVAPVITARFDTGCPHALEPGSLEVRELAWGYEAARSQGLIFNTRLDGAEKPLWRASMEHRRCLIPCRAFFETADAKAHRSGHAGRPAHRRYEFRSPDDGPLLIGGIWEGERFSMVTTGPNEAVSPIHHRMPLVVRPDEVPMWLGPGYSALADRSAIGLAVRPEERSGQQLPLF